MVSILILRIRMWNTFASLKAHNMEANTQLIPPEGFALLVYSIFSKANVVSITQQYSSPTFPYLFLNNSEYI